MKRTLLVALLFLAAGCTLQPTHKQSGIDGMPDSALVQKLEQFNQWSMEGKLAVRHNRKSQSARIQWQQQGEHFDIHLSGPAGLKATRVYGHPGHATLEQAGHTEHARSVDTLSERLVGWPLPATELQYWLRGLPAPSRQIESASYTTSGQLAALEQSGWQLLFSEHQTTVAELSLPGRIQAQRGDLTIILLAKKWASTP